MKKPIEMNKFIRFLVVVLGALVEILSIYLSFNIKFKGAIPTRNFLAFEASYIWIFIGFIVINLLFGTYTFYNKSPSDLLYLTLLSQLVLSIYIMAVTFAFRWLSFPRSVILVNFFVGGVIIYLYNYLAFKLYHMVQGSKKILVVGESEPCLKAVVNFSNVKNKGHEVTHVALSNYYNNVKGLSKDVDIVYIAGNIDEKERLKIYEYLMKSNKKLFVSANFENLMMVNPKIMNFEDESLIEVSNFKLSEEDDLIKRFLDIIFSLVLLVVVSPIIVLTAIAIKIDSPGPVFYKQERVTLHQKTFNMLKFRSMKVDAEAKSGPMLAKSDDDRVTRVGKFIRKTRIDELPQLINILKGDMSLIGPRPERPYFVEQFKTQNPYYPLRHNVRAGLTGYAQVYGKYSTDFNNKLNFDLLYIKNYSLGLDFQLLFQTLKVLFDKFSSQGVDEDAYKNLDWSDFEDHIQVYY